MRAVAAFLIFVSLPASAFWPWSHKQRHRVRPKVHRRAIPEDRTPARPSGDYRIRFRDELGIPGDIRFSGVPASRTIGFMCESAYPIADGSELRLVISHSPGIDSRRSFLSVTLNYGVLRSIGLNQENRERTEVTIPLPPRQLKTENRLVLAVEQYPTGGAPGRDVWTSIDSDSFITVRQDLGRRPSETALPAPFVDPHSYRAQSFDVLLSGALDSEAIEAACLLVANFVHAGAPRPVRVDSVRSAGGSGPLLVVAVSDGEPAGGIARWSSRRDGSPVLTIAGNSGRAVRAAAASLIARLPVRPAPSLIPRPARFTLADLGVKRTYIDAEHGGELVIPLLATPDVRFLPYSHQVTLRVKADAPAGARLAASWNDRPLGDFPVREIARGPVATATFPIPAAWLRQNNVLRVRLSGSPGSVLDDTQFYLPREYETTLPDLALLRSQLYPFSLSDTIVRLPSRGAAELAPAAIRLANVLGRMSDSAPVDFKIRRVGEPMEGSRAHFINLSAAGFDNPTERIFPNWPLRRPLDAFRNAPVVQEAISPWNSKRIVLSLQAPDVEELEQAIDTTFSPGTLAQLGGDTALFLPDGLRCFTFSAKTTWSRTSYLARMEAWFRANWLALPLILTGVSGLMFLAVRMALEHYKSRRTAAGVR